MKNKTIFTILPFDIEISISNGSIEELKNSHFYRNKIIKRCLGRKKHKNIIDLLQKYNFETYRCGFCGEYNTKFILESKCDIDNKKIIITGISHKRSYNKRDSAKYYCYGKNKNCKGKTFNPNSIEFIMKTRNISYDEAKEYLHSRNTTPFYANNHKSDDEYKKSQSRNEQWCIDNGIDYQERNQNMKQGHTLESYIERYGEEDGPKIKKEQDASKNVTLEKMILKYGEEEGKIKYEEWKFNTKHDRETYVSKYGKDGLLKLGNLYLRKTNFYNENNKLVSTYDDLIDISYYLLVNAPKDQVPYLIKGSPLIRCLKYYSSIKSFVEFFDITFDKLIIDLKDRYSDIHSIEKQQTAYSYFSYTDNGRILKSYYEIRFYKGLKDIGYNDNDMKVNSLYPNSTYFYDFYLPDIELYIEIAGKMEKEIYRDKMEMKENTFGALIVLPSEIQETLLKIKDMRSKI